MKHRRENWVAGVVVGVAAGVLTLSIPIIGWLIVVAFLGGLIRSTPRIPAVAGLMIGFGGAWFLLLTAAFMRCQRFDAAPNHECVQPDLGPWLLAAVVVLGAGICLLIAGLIRGRAHDRRK
jgi:formate hydrogenlyase subunit 3/multisubunit Na+/H+ antiporter MnhD subunit